MLLHHHMIATTVRGLGLGVHVVLSTPKPEGSAHTYQDVVVTGSEVPGDWQAVAAPAVLAECYLCPEVVSLRGGADAGGRATERLADSPHRTR